MLGHEEKNVQLQNKKLIDTLKKLQYKLLLTTVLIGKNDNTDEALKGFSPFNILKIGIWI